MTVALEEAEELEYRSDEKDTSESEADFSFDPINEMTENPHLKLEQYQEDWVDNLDRDDNFFGPLLNLQYEACF